MKQFILKSLKVGWIHPIFLWSRKKYSENRNRGKSSSAKEVGTSLEEAFSAEKWADSEILV